ncbi:MAG: hypothetical protein ABSC18_15380 [Verrucomicrobiota bacterium]
MTPVGMRGKAEEGRGRLRQRDMVERAMDGWESMGAAGRGCPLRGGRTACPATQDGCVTAE